MEENILDLMNLVVEVKTTEENRITKIMDFKENFCSKLSEEKEKLPYNINLVDEIHASENAHNRILKKLLQYCHIKNYRLLESFLSFLGEPFSKLEFKNPVITAEKDRIDIRIRGQNKTLIIENKIHGAGDQEQQIKRYIEIEKGRYTDRNIYVLYLTREGGSPSNSSLPQEEKKYLGDHYKEINYKYDILPWIKTLVNTDEQWLATSKLDILKSAIIQYKDHLEGMFFQREGEEKMKNNIAKLVKEKIKFNNATNLSKKMEIISSYKEYVSELDNYLSELERETKNSVYSALNIFVEQLKREKFDGIVNIQYPSTNKRFGDADQGIFFTPVNWNTSFAIGLEFEHELKDLFYGIRYFENDASEELQNQLSAIFINNVGFNTYWPYCEYIFNNKKLDDLIDFVGNGSLMEIIKNKITEILDETKEVTELYT